MLSEWGQLAWTQARQEIYRVDELLPPLVDRLRYADGLARAYRDLPADRREILHERLDDLARYVVTNGGYNPNRLKVHSLGGDPVQGSNLEAYAWSDGAAYRLFLHWDGDTLVVDRLEPHL